MELNNYVRAIIEDPTYQTKHHLTVPHQLIQFMTVIRESSENEVREWRALVLWEELNHRLVMRDPARGARTYVDWPEDLTARYPNYIGTFHTHPYRKKLSADVAVGFSIGDFVFYAEQYPPNYPVGVNMVVSGDKLFVAIFREVTRKVIGDDEKHEMETDENEAEAHARAIVGNAFNTQLMQLEEDRQNAEQEHGVDAGAEVEREFYAGIRGYVRVREDANLRMIRSAARRLQFELYIGRFGGTLHLKSDMLHFAPGLKGWHQRNMARL